MTLRPLLRTVAASADDLPPLSRLAGRLEPEVYRRFVAAARAATEDIDLDALEQAILSGDPYAIDTASRAIQMNSRLAPELKVDLLRGFLLGAEYAYTNLEASGITGVSFDLVNPLAVQWAETVGAARITEVGNETILAIRELVTQAASGQMDAYKLARVIKNDNLVGLHSRQLNAVENFRLTLEADGTLTDAMIDRRVARYADAQLRFRAQMIARTETMTASSEGQRGLWASAIQQGQLNPNAVRREWLIARIEGLCLNCEAFEGQTAPIGGEYVAQSGGGVPSSKGPPLHPNCKCSEGIVLASEAS